jgi:O-antigen/teichoic acid export membrane protein
MSKAAIRAPALYVAGKIANLLLAPISVAVLPGVLGEEGYGRYGYWFGLISVYLVLFDMGAQPMLRRYLPELSAQRPGRASQLFRLALLLKLTPLSLVASALLFMDKPRLFFLLLAAGLLAALATNLADLLYAHEQMGLHGIVVFVRKAMRLLLVPALFLVLGIPGILAALIIAELVGLLVALPAIRLLHTPREPLAERFANYYGQGLLIFVGMLLSIVLGRLPVFAAEWSGQSLEIVGRIALCVDLTYFALKELNGAVSEALFPRLVVARSIGQPTAVAQLLALNYRLVNLVGLGTVSLGIGLVGSFLPLLGDQFYQAERGMQFLLPIALLGSWNFIHNQTLLMEQRSHLVPINQGIGLAAMSVTLMAYWPAYDVNSLAAALLIGVIATTVTSYLQTRGQAVSKVLLRSFAGLVPGACLVTPALLAIAPRGMAATSLAFVCGSAAYLLSALLFGGIAEYEREWLRRAVTKVLR